MGARNILNKAIIRNAKVCTGFNNIGYEAKFNIERDNKGWDYTEGVGVFGVSGGSAFLISLTNSPVLSRSYGLPIIDSSIYSEIVLRYRYKKNSESSIATTGKIQFATQFNSLFSDAKSISFTVVPDGDWHTYYINMSTVYEWVGYISNLKIFFTTNGAADDEICLSYIRVQASSFSFCTDDCYAETNDKFITYNFDEQQIKASPTDFIVINTGLNSGRSVAISADPVILNNKVMSLNRTGGIDSGPSVIKNFDSPISRGYFSCRFRVSQLAGNIKIQTDFSLNIDAVDIQISSSGKLKVKQNSIYINFDYKHSIVVNKWYSLLITFDVSTGLFNVDVDGVQFGRDLILESIRTITNIRIDNSAEGSCNLYIDDFIVVETAEESSTCPGSGKQGEILGTDITFDQLSIIEGVNDSLIININDYGDEVIKLYPETNLSLSDIRFRLERALASVDMGGYVNVEVSIYVNKLRIKSGTFGFDSKVEVKQYLESPLSELLGFTKDGNPIGESKLGIPPYSNFQFSNTYRAPTRKLQDLLVDVGDKIHSVVQDPQRNSVDIGFYRAGETGRKNKISGVNATIIDLHNKASEEGFINEIYFHGILSGYTSIKFSSNFGSVSSNIFNTGEDLSNYNIRSGDILVIDTPGYIDNGSYIIAAIEKSTQFINLEGVTSLTSATLLSFYIHNVPKIKQLRPRKDGTLFLVNEVEFGTKIAEKIYSRSLDSHKVNVNWYVHRGDFIGIYNAQQVYIGNDPNSSDSATLYLNYDHDVIDDIKISNIEGYGVLGVGLYGVNTSKQDKAIYDITLDTGGCLDYVDIYATQIEEVASYNLCTAIDNGLSIVATVTGTHKHRVFRYSDALEHDIIHNNVGYNLPAMTDGITFASNGYLGAFQQTTSGASYFYISGDGEFADGTDLEPSLEGFRPRGDDHLYIHSYQADPFDITFNFTNKVTIDKFKIYFKEFPNADGYWLEYLKQPGLDLDSSRIGYELIGKGNDKYFTRVRLNNLILSDPLPSGEAFEKHFNTKFDGYMDMSKLDNARAVTALYQFPFTILEKEINSVRTSSLNWHCNYHSSTKISEVELLTNISTKASIDSLFELYFSKDGEFFQRATGEKIVDNQVRYKISYPVKYLRIVVEPPGLLKLDKIIGSTQEDSIRFKDTLKDMPTAVVDLITDRGTFSEPQEIKIKNLTGVDAALDISIDTVELENDILLKSSLNSKEDIDVPEIGPAGILVQDLGYDLPTLKNVAINSKVFVLKNLIDKRAFYITEDFDSESDNFSSIIDLTKWKHFYTQFPSGNTAGHHLGLKFPGFSIFPEPGPTGSPKNDSAVVAKLRSTWEILGNFSATIVCSYDARGGRPTHMGSAIGIQDSSGREIVIKKDRVLYQKAQGGGTITYKYIEYLITDSLLGTIETKRTYDDSPAYGIEDDLIEYSLSITRIKTTETDLLQFHYTDTVNGTGTQQFGDKKYVEVNLKNLSTPLVGKLKIIIYNYWNTNTLLSVGTPGSLGTHVKINKFLFGGESSYIKRYNFISGQYQTSADGYIGISNQSSSNKIRLLALDLGQRYCIDSLENYSKTGKNLWSSFNIQYSSSEESNPNLVNWGNSCLQNVRWLLFSEEMTSSGEIKYLDYLRVYPDILNKPPGVLKNTIWKYLGNFLSDNKLNTFLNQLDYPIFLIKLENIFKVVNFKLLDTHSVEYVSPHSIIFNGWTSNCYFSTSSSISDDPSLAAWDNWLDYKEENKEVKPIKWLVFKNLNTEGAQYVSEVEVSTEGQDFSSIGQSNDRVDCTEYSNWFEVDYSLDLNISTLSGDLNLYENYLYGASTYKNSAISEVFNDTPTNPIYLFKTPANIWRCFGEINSIEIPGKEYTVSGANGSFTVVEEPTKSISVDYYTTSINAIELEVSSKSLTGLPNNIEIQIFEGTDPIQNSSWTTVFTGTNLVTTTPEGELEFYNGNSFTQRFEPPLITSGIRLKITDATYYNNNELINISKFKIFSKLNYENSRVAVLENDITNKVGGTRSLKITCPSGTINPQIITAGGNFNLEPDPLWSIQDYLSFYIKISESKELDLEQSYLRLGKDKNFCYKWPLVQIKNLIDSEFINANLKFLDVLDTGRGTINYDQYDPFMDESQVDFIKGPIGFLQLELKPKYSLTKDIIVWIDNLDIVRENFDAKGINNTLYLNNRELLYFPLVGFDLRKGFFEATITPDWDYQSKRVLESYEANAIFAAYNDELESLVCYYDLNRGLTLIITSRETKLIASLGLITTLEKYKPFKLSVVWDADGYDTGGITNSTVRLWLNDHLMGDLINKWNITTTKNSTFYIGSMVATSDVSIRGIDSYFTSEYYKIVPDIKSLSGAIENLIISSNPKKLEYSTMQRLKDQLYISLDGITYYPGNSEELPFKLPVVENLEEVSVWIKSYLPINTANLKRTGFIKTRWRLPE